MKSILSLSHVCKSFSTADGAPISVLNDLNAEIQTGEIVAILGQSGSGKSTLLGLIAGLDDCTSGEIRIDDQDFSGLSNDQRTQIRGEKIGFIFQQFHLIQHLNVRENVMLPLEIKGDENAKARAVELLREVGLSHRLEQFPGQLSGGECQRVAMARALVHRPRLLLADEPSGNLDPKTSDDVMNLFFETVRAHKMTSLLVTHNIELAKKCDRILRISEGKLVEAL
jgi:putative ABC transport system ATP-binding protein